jgi:hypothetical protein
MSRSIDDNHDVHHLYMGLFGIAPPLKNESGWDSTWSSSTSGSEIHCGCIRELFGYTVAPDSRKGILVGMT